jgi:hypothetical protein
MPKKRVNIERGRVPYVVATPTLPRQYWATPRRLLGGALALVTVGWLWIRQPSEPKMTSFPCDVTDLETLHFRPGEICLLDVKAGTSLSYPFKDTVTESGSSLEQENYKNALLWLNRQPSIDTYSARQFLEMMRVLHKKIKPDVNFDIPMKYILKYREVGLFDRNTESLKAELSPAELKTLNSITKKVSIIEKQVEIQGSEGEGFLRETLMMDLYLGNFRGKVSASGRFNDQEKAFINEFYSFKPKVSDGHLITELDKILNLYRSEPAKAAANLHMLWLDTHPGSDGNGRTARAISNHLRRRAGLEPMVYASRESYDASVYAAQASGNYSSFFEYTEESNFIEAARAHCLPLYKAKCNEVRSYDTCYNMVATTLQEEAEKHHKKEYSSPAKKHQRRRALLKK